MENYTTMGILITRPNYEITTRYLHSWNKEVIALAKKKGFEIYDLQKEKANRKELESRISKLEPMLLLLNGHGNTKSVTGQDGEVLIQAGDNEHILKSKVTYAFSCSSAAELGPKSIEAGALTYIGYTGEFIFVHETKLSNPLEDELASLFLDPSNKISISLLKGHSTGESSDISKMDFKKNMEKLLSSETPDEWSVYARFAWWNMKHQVCLGDCDAKII